MLTLRNQTIFVALQSIDMRKSFDGLAALVKNSFSKNPLDGAYFVFINKSADRVKILYWDTDGYEYCGHLPVHRQAERLFKTSGVKHWKVLFAAGGT